MCVFTVKGYVTFQDQEYKSVKTRYALVHVTKDITLICKPD